MKITRTILETEIQNGLRYKDIAIKYKVSQSYISILLKKYGLKKKLEDVYIDKTYGNLTIKYRLADDKHSHAVWMCECICGKRLPVVGHSLTSGNTTSCGCLSRKKGKQHANYKGYEEISSSMWSSIVHGAKFRKLEFKITIQDIWKLYLSQNRKCALTGLDIEFAKTRKSMSSTTASLDRIDSSKGYTLDNIHWVHKEINFMKQEYSLDHFIKLCELVVKHNRNKI